MPAAFRVTDEEIEYAERILLPLGQSFDEERRDFIRNFETIDLQAVPGSGKTTALLAKLLILEKHLPFDDGSGVLVLSHTNAAVDEIKSAIGIYCPKLYAYPNFVGTIQSFVDRFLAIPYGHSCLAVRFDIVDSAKFSDRLWKWFQIIQWNEEFGKPGPWLYKRHEAQAKREGGTDKRLVKKLSNEMVEADVRRLCYDYDEECFRIGFDGEALNLKDKNNLKFKGLQAIIHRTFSDGYLSYGYAYSLAMQYLSQFPLLVKLLQGRFAYVFVDEMQDMDPHQYGLLEALFANGDYATSIYQRIGDKNQAIFGGKIFNEEIWTDRSQDKTLRLEGSHRLNPTIAKVVESFGLSRITIEGKSTSGRSIRPHLLVYDEPSKVIPKYITLLRKLIDSGDLPENPQGIYKAICWVKEKKEDLAQLTLPSYFPEYTNQSTDQATDKLADYLSLHHPGNKTLKALRGNIIEGLITVLRLEDIRDEKKQYTPSRLYRHLTQIDNLKGTHRLDEFNLRVYQLCLLTINNLQNDALAALRFFIPEFLSWFEASLSSASAFVSSQSVPIPMIHSDERSEPSPSNTATEIGGDIKVAVTTVHRVKGQTHTATLYLESFFHDFEPAKLSKPFMKSNSKIKGPRQSETARMLYVGFSRPTHLLCFAVQKDRFETHLSEIDASVWEIVHI